MPPRDEKRLKALLDPRLDQEAARCARCVVGEHDEVERKEDGRTILTVGGAGGSVAPN